MVFIVLIVSLTVELACMTNPIEMITHPLNKIEIDFKLQIYIIKVERESVLGLYKPTSSEATVTYCTSSITNMINPFLQWNDQLFEKGKKMTKEEFMNHDFKMNDAFKHFKFFKDSYDGLKMIPVAKTHYNQVMQNDMIEVDGVGINITYSEKIDQVIYDLSIVVRLSLN